VANQTEREIDRCGLATLLLPRLDEGPEHPPVHGREREGTEIRMKLLQMQGVVSKRTQMLVFPQELGCRMAKRPGRSNTEYRAAAVPPR